MRFSILTLELDTPSEPADENRAEPVVRLIADSNISCVCLFGCGQHASSSPSAQAENVREGSIAEVLSRRLNSLGLKYDYIWYPSHPGAEDCECGVAILTQHSEIGRRHESQR